ncbi:hypothetical protein IAU60_001550 [Kwoniella sp. DSM 27419]
MSPVAETTSTAATSTPRDSGIGAIGAFFIMPYDRDAESDGDDTILTPSSTPSSTPPGSKASRPEPVPQARRVSFNVAPLVRVSTAKGYKNALQARIQAGVGVDEDEEDDGSDYGGDQGGKRVSSVRFPAPSLQPAQGHGRGYPPPSPSPQPKVQPRALGTVTRPLPPARSYSDNRATASQRVFPMPPRSNTAPTYPPVSTQAPQPMTSSRWQGHAHAQAQLAIDTVTLTPPQTFFLPPPTSPISPMLAAPPRPRLKPLSPPSSPFAQGTGLTRVDSSDNGSVRGFDVMVEKKALFREGQEELLNPFSTRRPGKRAVPGRMGTKSILLMSGMGVDFWKRFSVHVRLDEQEKAQSGKSGTAQGSAWLNDAQNTRGRIKKIIWAFMVLLVLIVAAVVVCFVIVRPHTTEGRVKPL